MTTTPATTELTLQGSRNISSQKFFVFVEECERNLIKLINPAGKVLTVPKHIFEAPVAIHTTDFSSTFTQEQMITVEKTIKPKRGTRKKASKKKAATKAGKKTGVGATWTAPNLTFYKFQIDPLDPKQTFKIELDSGQVFEIQKEEFNQVFSDIMLSSEYSTDGSYSFDEIPERALKFMSGSQE